MKNILMIDLETTGTKPGCKILSLGAFGFGSNAQQVEFYERFSLIQQVEAGLTDSQQTMEWWKKQSPEAFAESFGGKAEPAYIIPIFVEWLNTNFDTEAKDFQVWSCGIDFDFPIFNEFISRFGYSKPLWPFWKQYDYRTIKNLFKGCKEAEGNVLKHTALEDAKAQMRGLRHFHQHYIEKV